MKTKDRLVFNGNTCTVTDGSPGNYTVLYNNSSELVDKMITDDDNIFLNKMKDSLITRFGGNSSFFFEIE